MRSTFKILPIFIVFTILLGITGVSAQSLAGPEIPGFEPLVLLVALGAGVATIVGTALRKRG
ncbi:MAG: hypothetical protein JW839_11830 [Candidatus Lokiarchaeota archaeon]|nr:hypothetical protein [Candidatus Lokiarchaeota archaeon]